MNNDIAHEFNNYVNLQRQEKTSAHKSTSLNPQASKNASNDICEVDMSNSMEILGVINKAKITQTTPSVISSCKSFLEDPLKAQCYNDVCDFYVQKGYKLEDAVEMTEKFFLALQNKDTY